MSLLDWIQGAVRKADSWNDPVSPVRPETLAEAKGFITPYPSGASPSPIPRPSPEPNYSNLRNEDLSAFIERIQSGLSKFNPEAPIATLSGELAQSGRNLPEKVDPLLPVILSLIESRGLLDPKPAAASNPYNIMSGGNLVQYPDPGTAILGGNGRLGLSGLLRQGGLYQDFLDSGNLEDFFGRFTPSSDPLNPSTDQLLERYSILRKLFE